MLLLLMTGWTAVYAADYNIVDYGAKPDTTILCTSALQQAIDDCSRAGGGRPHQGGIKSSQLTEIADSIADEKERSYPEATMWGTLPAKGFFVRHARNVQFSHIDIQTAQPDARPDFVRIDTEGWGDQGDGTFRLQGIDGFPDILRLVYGNVFAFIGKQRLVQQNDRFFIFR